MSSNMIAMSVLLTANGIYIGQSTDMPLNKAEIRMYQNIWMDTINGNCMRFYNNTTTTNAFGFYCGSINPI